jgi:probable DNA repair protein
VSGPPAPPAPPLPDDGVCVITINNRLARALGSTYASAMLGRGARAWRTPRILPFEAFVSSEWEAAAQRARTALPRLLTPVEVRALWLACVRADSADALLAPAAAAASAAAARELLLRYDARLDVDACGEHPDARAFVRWHARFQQRLDDGAWIDLPAAASRLAALVRSGVARMPAALRLAGFEQLTPQQQELLQACRDAGVRVTVDAPGTPSGAARRAVFACPEEELEAAARWARALLDAGEPGPIGIVVPDLEQRLDAIESCFEDVLHPAVTVAPAAAVGARAFNVSLGRALALVPVVSDALAALHGALGRADATAAGQLLMSAYLRGALEEQGARLALEARLRDEGVREIRTRRLARLASRAGAALFARQLEGAAAAAARPRARLSLDRHVRHFADMLAALGWPQGRALDSAEFQAVEALRGQLQVLGGASAVSGPCTAETALALLSRLLTETTFQPRAAPAPVQVMGVLEAAGMRFSSLWVAGMHDAAWPATASPNALLPMQLQRRHAMPGASPQQSLERARHLTARLLAAAPAPLLSHAAADGDEELRVSPLIGAVPLVAASDLPRATQALPDAALAAAAPVLERLADWRVREVRHGWRARGGSRVLTDQAACPFRAFARHRLGACGVERAPTPLDARARGNLAHRLMQSLFQQLADHQAIAQLDAEAREALAAQAAGQAVEAILRRHPGEVSPRLAQAEVARLARLARRWLDVELARAPFQVEAVEQRRSVRVGGLTLDVQLDRVDRVGGRRMLLDYKTGRAHRGAWFGERPDEPQLPLYALALDADGGAAAPVAAVCFARLKRGEEGFEGVADEAGWAPGVVALGQGSGGQKGFADMAALKSHWARVLGNLAANFADGQAQVDPKPQACRHCDVRALCRVDAVLGPRAGDEA